MRKTPLLLILTILINMPSLASSISKKYDLTISIEKNNPKFNTAPIAIAIFNQSKGFPKKEKLAYKKFFIKPQLFPYKLQLPKGKYALAIFHDHNQNKKLDKNFLGIPKEPFGFSNNAKLFMGPPSFEKSSFFLDQDKKISILLKTFP